MITERLSNRLKAVASFVEKNSIIADIGSDHAYLPCYLIKKGIIQKAIAGEVAEGPYNSALYNVSKEGLADNVEVRLANGLFAIKEGDQVDTITIAGMGGSLIATLLENGKSRIKNVRKIITQPNINAKVIREWAVSNGWKISAEHILKEGGKIYEIIVLIEGQSNYTECELLLGPYLHKERNNVFCEKWERELLEWQRVISLLEQAEESSINNQKKETLLRYSSHVKGVLEK